MSAATCSTVRGWVTSVCIVRSISFSRPTPYRAHDVVRHPVAAGDHARLPGRCPFRFRCLGTLTLVLGLLLWRLASEGLGRDGGNYRTCCDGQDGNDHQRQAHDASSFDAKEILRRLPRRASTYTMPPAMNIVDSQVHIWGADTPHGRGRRTEPRSPEALPHRQETLLLRDGPGRVRRMVLVPPSWEGDRNDLALEAARPTPTGSR